MSGPVTQDSFRKERMVHGMMFQAAVNSQVPSFVPEIAGAVRPSTGKAVYKGVGAVPQVQRHTGQRMAERPRPLEYELTDELFDLVLELTGDEWRSNETIDATRRRLPEIQAAYGEHWETLIIETLQNGETGLCYDGKPFFATTHKEGKQRSSQSNIYTKTGVTDPTKPNPVQFGDAVWAAIAQWSAILDDQNRPTNDRRGRNFVLIVPHTMEEVATVALGAENILDGGQSKTNTLRLARRTSFDLVSSVRYATGDSAITDAFDLILKDGRSLIRQESLAAERTSLGPASETYHKEDRVEFGLRFKRAAGYGDWKSAIRVKFTT